MNLCPTRKLFFCTTFLIILGAIFLLTSCSKKDADSADRQSETADGQVAGGSAVQPIVEMSALAGGEVDSEWSNHIQAYSQGWLPAEQPIRVRFSHDVVTADQLNQAQTALVEMQPKTDFSATFISTNELLIKHNNRPQPGQVFSIAILPNGLQGVAADLEPFTFQVQTLRQDYELRVSGLTPSDDSAAMTLRGTVRTSDTATAADVENTLRAQQGSRDLVLTWTHQLDRLNHEFAINGIQRADSESTVNVTYSAQALGVDKQGSHSIAVPSLNEFVVTAVRAVQTPQQYVEVNFSEPLDRSQNLIGLVRLNNEPANVRVDGSSLRVFPAGQLSGEATIAVESTISSSKNIRLPTDYQTTVTFVSQAPGVRFLSRGSILPPSDSLTVPFEAINVNAVWVTAFKVYGNNIQQFLQNNNINNEYVDQSTGRYLWRKKISLPSVPFDKWQRYDIDLSELMRQHDDGIVNLQLHIDNTVLAFQCPNSSDTSEEVELNNYDGPGVEKQEDRPGWFYQYYSSRNGYITYEQRNDPCHPGYYTYYQNDQVRVSKNFLVSDIGLLVKQGRDNDMHVLATGIRSGEASSKVNVSVYNYQHQLIASGVTDRQGMATLKPDGAGYYLIAEKDGDKNYLRFPRNEALPTSQFDTGGDQVRKGLKGFIFGERDVWRPGDHIYLTFVLQDDDKKIPRNHPVSLDLFDPKGTLISSKVNSSPVGALYTFDLKTEEASPTGNWRAVVKVGGEYFDKSIKVETIVPNRLKVELTPAQRPLQVSAQGVRTELFAQWLNGATAKNLRADTQLALAPMNTQFEGWSQFEFDDPATQFDRYQETVFDGKLNDSGLGSFNVNLSSLSQAPGKLRATFTTRVFEQSGNFSTAIRTEEVLPFQNWVGLYVPKGDGYGDAISRDDDHEIDLLSIDSNAQPVANRQLTLAVYRIGWRWWWDQGREDLANYVHSQNAEKVAEANLTTDTSGRVKWTIEKNKYDWGRHLVRVCDQQSGHCSGKQVYLGWSWNNQVNPDSATQLMLGTDKDRYQVGDTAVISIPELGEGKIFYSLENGTKVLQQRWLSLEKGARSFEIPVTADLAPNVYINAVLLLPHLQRESDAPIRLFGITPLLVDNPATHIEPEIAVPETVRPQSRFDITVTEKNNKKMSYTLAVVDEGLLGITGYRTPDPHNTFYRREALGVTTWDIFDGVIGAYGANLERLLRIGGGDSEEDESRNEERRFPPVVRFLGAFTVEAGESRTHNIELPQYMGAVRVMVVAANDKTYGKAEKTITVTQPLTLLATLPRVLGPNEDVYLPVNVFANDNTVRDVKIDVSVDELFELENGSAALQFSEPGDKIALLKMKVKDRVGKGAITVRATSGDEVAEETIHIESRSVITPSTLSAAKILQPGETWNPELTPHGMEGTNVSSVAISSLPSINLQKRLGYLIRYPHGCVEQTTSAVFPQIWLSHLTDLSQAQKDEIENHVNAAINKYRRYQNASGSFSYWPGGSYTNEWANNYVTHFLLEAKEQGYPVPNTMLDNAIQYLRGVSTNENYDYSRLVSAYRLYVLALAKQADLAAMNRLRENLLRRTGASSANWTSANYNDHVARWQLALAYQQLGLNDVAQELMQSSPNNVYDYRYGDYTYGSSLRDSAILLMAYSRDATSTAAWDQAQEIANWLSQDTWYSTHSTSWALMSLSYYAKVMKGDGNQFSLNENNGPWQNLETVKTVYRHEITPQQLQQRNFSVRNDSDHPLHVEVSNTGTASQGNEIASQNGLRMYVNFTDMNGVPLSIDSLPQGQDFVAEVVVDADNSRNSYKIEDIAMSLVVPSGWQIRNERLQGAEMPDGLDYQDIRDDRVMSYFSLWRNHRWYYRYNDQIHNTQTIRVILNASFAGKFYLPGWSVQSMYDEDIAARNVGRWVEVVADATN